MKKAMLGATFLVLILASSFVLAVGSSTKSSSTYASANDATVHSTCSDKATVQERVQCRLVAREATVAGSDESCQNVPNAQACTTLYAASARCYTLANNEKSKCFKSIAGITTRSTQNPEATRNYLVLLLYEAQERVEARVNAGQVSAADGARLIAMIVDAKQSILRGDSKDMITSHAQELRRAWAEVMP